MIIIKIKNKVKFPTAYVVRMLFSVIGFLFILLFTVRGIYQITFTLVNYSNDIVELLSGKTERLFVIIGALKQSPGDLFDTLLLVLCGLVMIHGMIGMYYAILTNYNMRKMSREKRWFYLQIISAVAAGSIISTLMMPSSKSVVHSLVSFIIIILIAILGSFHIAKGFFNACITLGISVSQHTNLAVKILSWVIAVISAMQVIIIFI